MIDGKNIDENAYKRAKERVEEVKGFYTHLITYIVVNTFLIIINLISSPNSFWFYWVTGFWGIGLFFHFLSVFVLNRNILGKEWEDRKIKEYMEKEERKK
ncbi:MAG: 2TM domain-containing protein [Methanobacteriaceae archaeon]